MFATSCDINYLGDLPHKELNNFRKVEVIRVVVDSSKLTMATITPGVAKSAIFGNCHGMIQTA